MKSWQEQVSELKDLLEKQQLNSKKKWPGYFSTPLHSHRRELYERYGGQEPREESVQAEVPNANQRATGDGAGNVNTTRELPVLEAGLHTSPLVLAD